MPARCSELIHQQHHYGCSRKASWYETVAVSTPIPVSKPQVGSKYSKFASKTSAHLPIKRAAPPRNLQQMTMCMIWDRASTATWSSHAWALCLVSWRPGPLLSGKYSAARPGKMKARALLEPLKRPLPKGTEIHWCLTVCRRRMSRRIFGIHSFPFWLAIARTVAIKGCEGIVGGVGGLRD